MPQVQINSANIGTFIFNVTFDIFTRSVKFDATPSQYIGGGINNVLGIAFALTDGDGVELAVIDWTAPQLPTPATNSIFTLDLSNVNFAFLFQRYTIIGEIKDQNGTIYQTLPVYKTVCQPVNFNDSGYVPGLFQIQADCTNNALTVKELTLLTYNNLQPTSVAKAGTLYYPTGTISNITFSQTPFSNNNVYTGQSRIKCETDATYDLSDGVYVVVTYLTDNAFDITCNNRMADLMCCIVGIQQTYINNCNTAVGQRAKQQLDEITPAFLIGLTKEINGQDASEQAFFIKKQLNCNCGATSLGQNEVTPTNPSVYNIVLTGVGGTTVPAGVITGSTKTFSIASNVYQVVKGDTGDLAWSIVLDTSVPNTVKYKITFNYDTMAGYILTAIQNDPTLLNQLNSLVNAVANVSMVGLNGSCVINMSLVDYTLIQAVNNSTFITSVTINGVVHAAPTNLFGTDFIGIANWLNSLSSGTFTVQVTSGVLLIQSSQNPNVIATMTFTTPNLTVPFQATNKTLLQVLQAIIDFCCNLTALQVALGQNLSLCTFDYSGNVVTTTYTGNQQAYNAGVSSAICNIVARMNALTGITCTALRAAFPDSPSSVFGAAGRLYGTDGANCIGWSDRQIASLVIAAINSYSDVKAAYCAISCTTPATCPDVANINLAMVGSSIGIYGLTWSQNPLASQTVTVQYRVHGTGGYTTSTNALVILPNGNISGTTPFLIPGAVAGTTYDVFITNNCGGAGFVKQITAPTGTVFTGTYLLDNIIYNICGESPVTLYSSAPFATGVTMYTNIGLTTVVTGFTFIASTSGGDIFQLNTSTGVVGADTFSACNTGTAGVYRLGNNSSTICPNSPVTLYTNGAFAVGGTLYTDSALTHPQTGFTFVVNNVNNTIYNLNSSTGVVGASTGLLCAGNAQIEVNNSSADVGVTGVTVNGIAVTGISFPVNAGQDVIGATSQVGTHNVVVTLTHTASGQSLQVSGSDHVVVGCQDIISDGSYTFTGVVVNTSNEVEVLILNTPC
jgi:hypothetical protein